MFLFAILFALQPTVDQWRNLEDVFEPVAAVPLETLDVCLIGKIRKIVHIESYLFILDEQSGIVYQFHKDGHFVRQLGEIGEGPGEYIFAANIEHVFNGHIGVFDRRKAQVKVYSIDGDFVCETPRRSPLKIFASGDFAWPEKDRLYLAGYNIYPRDTTWHMITNDQISKRIAVFGEYEPPEQGDPPTLYHCFLKVDEHIWTGSPYHHRVDVYDLEGKPVTSFYQPNPNAKIGDYFEKGYIVLQGQRIKLSDYNPTPRNSRFATFGDFVFTRCAFVANVFQKDFTHVKTLNAGRFHYLNDQGPYVISQAMDEPVDEYVAQMHPQERAMLEDVGWFEADHGEANPFLIFWRVKKIKAP